VHIAIVCAAALYADDALDRALHTPLRAWLTAAMGGFSIDAGEGGGGDGVVSIEGIVDEDAARSDSGVALRVRVDGVWSGQSRASTRGTVALTVLGEPATGSIDAWREGRRVRLPALLRRPARYLDAGVPDFERAMARRGVTLVGTVKSGALVEVLARGGWFDEHAAVVRAQVRSAIGRWVAPRDPQSAAVATAILIGDRAAMAPDAERRLQEAGTYHVVAISGGNIAMLASALLLALWVAGIRGAASSVIAAGGLVAYAAAITSGASVWRATWMAVTYFGLRVVDQRTAPVHAVALTSVALLLGNPLTLADVGFWLTVGATGGILLAATRVEIGGGWWWRLPASIVVASIAAEAALTPVAALVFERVTVAGLGLNLIAIPCMAVVQGGAVAVWLFDIHGLATLARLAGAVTHWGAAGLLGSAALVDVAPWLTWRVPPPAPALVVAYYAAVAGWWMLARPATARGLRGSERRPRRQRWAWMLAALACGSWLWIVAAPPTLARRHGDGWLHVTMIDVGQGDAILVTLPNGRTLLVDAGGLGGRSAFDIGDRVVGPALRWRGVTRLDYLALTHFDLDHIGGARAVLRDFAPVEVWAGVPVPRHEPTQQALTAAAAARASWRWLQHGDRIALGDVDLRVLHPPLPDWERQRVRNDDSLVFDLRFGDASVVLTGDIGREVERALAPGYERPRLVVLKAPHHGSATSSSPDIVTALRPDVVIISCGRRNPFGHPAAVVVDRYHAVGAQVFRTDQDGQIELVTDGKRIGVETILGRARVIQ
jgi:competence protein ComEC